MSSFRPLQGAAATAAAAAAAEPAALAAAPPPAAARRNPYGGAAVAEEAVLEAEWHAAEGKYEIHHERQATDLFKRGKITMQAMRAAMAAIKTGQISVMVQGTP